MSGDSDNPDQTQTEQGTIQPVSPSDRQTFLIRERGSGRQDRQTELAYEKDKHNMDEYESIMKA